MLLILSILALFAGPLIGRLATQSSSLRTGIDGFILVAMLALFGLELMPHAYSRAGWVIFPLVAAGLIVPTLAERAMTHARTINRSVLALAFLGLALHAVIDGIPLLLTDEASQNEAITHLSVGVILHRLPLGLLIWWTVAPIAGTGGVLAALGVMSGCTIIGSLIGEGAVAWVTGPEVTYFIAFFSGALLHVIIHGVQHLPHGSDESDLEECDRCGGHERRLNGPPWAGALGAILGFLAVGAMMHGGHHQKDGESPVWDSFLHLSYESAPALVLGILGASLIRAFIAPGSLTWMGRGNAWSQASRGMIFGLPLPVCSCGVLPLYDSLVRARVPSAAAGAFLIATPELGIDAILLSIPLLGGELTIARVVCAALVALLIGAVISARFVGPSDQEEHVHVPGSMPVSGRLISGARFGLVELVDHTMPWIILGIIIAAVLEPHVDLAAIVATPGWAQVPLLAAIGIPIYVCAAGATPLVAVLAYAGMSPGALIAFLLTGPATNMTTFGILTQLHGRRAAVTFGVSVLMMATVMGWLVNLTFQTGVGFQFSLAEHHHPSIIQRVCFWFLVLLVAASMWRQGPRGILEQITSPADHSHHHGSQYGHHHGHHHGHHCQHHHHGDHRHHE